MVRAELGSQLQTTSPVVTPVATVTSPLAGAVAVAVAPQDPTSFNNPGATVLSSTMIQQQPLISLPSLLPQLPAEPPLEVGHNLITLTTNRIGT